MPNDTYWSSASVIKITVDSTIPSVPVITTPAQDALVSQTNIYVSGS
jgi:hypothetical protein